MRTLTAACLLVSSTAWAVPYTEAPVTNGGKIAGKVTYDGVPPKPTAETVKQDPAVCGATHPNDSWIVGADKGVENVVVYITEIASGKKMAAPTAPVLDQKGCHYVPAVQVIAAGATLQVKNSDPILHNVHEYQGQGGATVLNLAMPKQGMVIPKKISKAGGTTLKCDVHSFMRGMVFVAANPYYALTGKDGKFEITDVPPGTYQVSTFHEVGSPRTETVTVAAGATASFNPKIK